MGTIDLGLLPAFIAVADAASFSGAAARLGIPKSSVSRQVAALERALDATLFHRTTRRVALSTAGAALRERVGPGVAALQASIAQIAEGHDEPRGRLRITAPVDIGTTVLANVLARLTARHPAVEVDLRLSNTQVDLVAEGVDAALRIALRPLRDSALVARRMATIALRLYAAPAYLARRGVPRSLDELAGHAWLDFGPRGRTQLVGPGREAVTAPSPAIACDDMSCMRELVRHGAGIGALSSFLVERDIAAGELVAVLPRWSVPSGALWLLRHAGAVPRKVEVFDQLLRDALAARPLDAGA